MHVLSTLIHFTRAFWPQMVAVGVTVGAVTMWLVNLRQRTKLGLEIQKLRAELKKDSVGSIRVATIEEVAEFARRNPEPAKVTKFLRERLLDIGDGPSGRPAEPDEVAHAMAVLEATDRLFEAEADLAQHRYMWLLIIQVCYLGVRPWFDTRAEGPTSVGLEVATCAIIVCAVLVSVHRTRGRVGFLGFGFAVATSTLACLGLTFAHSGWALVALIAALSALAWQFLSTRRGDRD